MLRIPLAVTVLLTTIASVAAQTPEPASGDVRIRIGDRAPAFQLPDQNGKRVSLNQLLRKKRHVAVVFHRSASW